MADRTPFDAPLRDVFSGLLWLCTVIFGLYLGVDAQYIKRIQAGFLLIAILLLACSIGSTDAIKKRALAVTAGLSLLLLTIGGLRGFILAAERWFGKPDITDIFVIAPVSLIVVGAGGALFYIRLKFRFCYGATEVLAGVMVAASKVSGEIKSAADVTTGWTFTLFTAGIYLVVRGLDNMHQGLIKEPLDTLVVWLSKYIPTTTRHEARTTLHHFLKVNDDLNPEGLLLGSFFGRECLSWRGSKTTMKPDFLGKLIPHVYAVHFVVLDDDSLVFKLSQSNATDVLTNTNGSQRWEPTKGQGPLAGWIAIPYKYRTQWRNTFQIAMESRMLETTPTEEVRVHEFT